MLGSDGGSHPSLHKYGGWLRTRTGVTWHTLLLLITFSVKHAATVSLAQHNTSPEALVPNGLFPSLKSTPYCVQLLKRVFSN